MTEYWLGINGFPLYEVSSYGQVRSIDRQVRDSRGRIYFRLGKTLKQFPDKDGYLKVTLYDDVGVMHAGQRVHVLVCTAFQGQQPDEKQVVAHRDGNNQNNNAWNLYWATHQENVRDAFAHGTRGLKSHCIRGHEMTEDNVYFSGKWGRKCKRCRNANHANYARSGSDKALAYLNRKKSND